MECISKKTKVMVVLGTRHEAIKAAPIIDRLRRRKTDFELTVVAIYSTREDFDHVLTPFNIIPDITINLTHVRQGLPSLASSEVTFVNLLNASYVIVTDSDGLPEAASVFRKPVLMLSSGVRKVPGVYSQSVKTVDCDSDTIAREAGFLLRNVQAYRKMADMENPYGDGQASERIVIAIKRWAKDRHRLLTPAEEFSPRNHLTELLRQHA